MTTNNKLLLPRWQRLGLIILAALWLSGCERSESEDGTAKFFLGDDLFISGLDVRISNAEVESLYISGEDLISEANITGSAYSAGRSINLRGNIGRDVYAAGMDVSIEAAVDGDAKLTGYDVALLGALAGDLLASGFKINIEAPVAGYALLSGKRVSLNSTISGDLALTAESVSFGPEARVDGKLIIYQSDRNQIIVPEYVIPESRIERRSLDDFRGGFGVVNFLQSALALLVWLLVLTLAGAILAAVAPNYLSSIRERITAKPFRTLGWGFIAISLATGSIIMLALTIIGAVLIPVVILVTLVALLLAYVIGVYILGTLTLALVKKPKPESFLQHIVAAGVGAVLATALALIPLLGWLLILALVLIGIGAITVKMMQRATPASES